jgi:hypothetical protein
VPQKPPSSLEDTKHQWLKDYERESAQMRPLFKPWKEPNRLTWFGHTDQTMKSMPHSNMPPPSIATTMLFPSLLTNSAVRVLVCVFLRMLCHPAGTPRRGESARGHARRGHQSDRDDRVSLGHHRVSRRDAGRHLPHVGHRDVRLQGSGKRSDASAADGRRAWRRPRVGGRRRSSHRVLLSTSASSTSR